MGRWQGHGAKGWWPGRLGAWPGRAAQPPPGILGIYIYIYIYILVYICIYLYIFVCICRYICIYFDQLVSNWYSICIKIVLNCYQIGIEGARDDGWNTKGRSGWDDGGKASGKGSGKWDDGKRKVRC